MEESIRIKIYTRSSNDALYTRMKSLLPEHIETERCTQFGEWWQAREYLLYLMRSDADIVINMDDDAFLLDWQHIEQMIYYMGNHGLHYCGMPDGGVSPHRCRSWCVVNPFFNIFRLSEIREVFKQYPDWVINSCGFDADWEANKPPMIRKAYNHDYYEPYASFFYFMYAKFNVLYLDAITRDDEISTVLLTPDNKPFLYHGWYAREFATDATNRERILKLYEEAKCYHKSI